MWEERSCLFSYPSSSVELSKENLSRTRTHYRPFCDGVSRRRGNPAVVRIQPEFPKAKTNTGRHCHPPPRRRPSDRGSPSLAGPDLSSGTVAEAARPLGRLLLSDGHDVDGDAVELRGSCHVSRDVTGLYISSRSSSSGYRGGTQGQENREIFTYAEVLQQIPGLDIDVQLAALGVLGEVEGGNLGDVLILAFTLLLLQLEGDAADGSSLDTLDQVGGVAGNL